jgi:hypothetical protein
VSHLSSLFSQELAHALAAGAGDGHVDETPYGAPIGIGIILMAVGALAYSGRWRSWSTASALRIYEVAPVALGWAGVGSLVGGLSDFLPLPLADIVGYPATAFFVLCLVGMVWLPRFMLPRWYRIQKGLERDVRVGKGARRRNGSSASGVGEGVGIAGSADGPEDVSFATTIGGSVGGVGVAEPAHPSAGHDTSSSEGGPETHRQAGSSPT